MITKFKIFEAGAINISEYDLFSFIYDGDLGGVQANIDGGTDVNCVDTDYNSDGLTPLLKAINKLNIDIIKMLIDAGADVNKVDDDDDDTPLTSASRYWYYEELQREKEILEKIIYLLLDAGADMFEENLADKSFIDFYPLERLKEKRPELYKEAIKKQKSKEFNL